MMANVDHEPIVGVIDNAHNPSRQLIVGDFIPVAGVFIESQLLLPLPAYVFRRLNRTDILSGSRRGHNLGVSSIAINDSRQG